jgi:hypothetical protein
VASATHPHLAAGMAMMKHGTVWATIVKDPIFQEQNRRSTNQFRNAYPDLYQAAGYTVGRPAKSCPPHLLHLWWIVTEREPRKKPIRVATDDQLAMSSVGVLRPMPRRRAQTSQGLLRGRTKSVPRALSISKMRQAQVLKTSTGVGWECCHR